MLLGVLEEIVEKKGLVKVNIDPYRERANAERDLSIDLVTRLINQNPHSAADTLDARVSCL